MKITVLSLFPEYFEPLLQTSIIKRAKEKDLFSFECVDFRSFTQEKHGHVDDTPYGGGAGMVLMCQPILDALKSVRTPDSKVILLSPQGKTFHQQMAIDLSKEKHLIFLCGHYEGFDERIRDYVDMQVSLGDFVLTGGEPACVVICDAILRMIPGVIKSDSAQDDSFSDGLLEHPQYTKPREYNGYNVPDVLLNGNHAEIALWRRKQQFVATYKKRKDLFDAFIKNCTDKTDLKLLNEVISEFK